MRVLVLGASGFIGKRIVLKAPEHIELTGTYFKNEIKNEQGHFEHLNYLDEELDWKQIIEPYSCIIVAARANAENGIERDNISQRSQAAFVKMIKAVKESRLKPFIIALNGSLTYGNRGEELVRTDDEINPVGFAKSYSIAEKPFRDYLAQHNEIAIVRAPWVLGPGSWFSQIYLEANKIPIIGKGKQWMAIVTLDDLAEYVWQLVEVRTRGVFHPKLISRCRQKDFARNVQQVTKKQTQKLGRFGLLRMEKQMRESILASIKLDDGEGNQSESEAAKSELKTAIKKIYAGFS
jgi:nucleoside-diphosphate-sugar epimerase